MTCPSSNIDVRLYRVADADYNLVGAFKSYSVSQDWNILGDYIDRDNIEWMKLSQIQMVRLYFLI